jgi:CRISPR-associated protein Cas5 subtype I-B
MPEKTFQVFDVWSDLACFKKNFATSSPLRFPFPPPSTVLGLCACIVGDKWVDFINRYLKGIELSVEPRFNEQGGGGYSKIRMGMKLIITKDSWNRKVFEGKRPFVSSPVPFELLRCPKYRIYIHSDPLRERLSGLLRAHKSYFTPYLGMAQFIANFRNVGEFIFAERSEGVTFIKSVFAPSPDDEWSLVKSEGAMYSQERYPLLRPTNSGDPNRPERDVDAYVDCVVPLTDAPIKISKGRYYTGDVYGVPTNFSTIPV